MVKKKMNWKTLRTKVAAFLICATISVSCFSAVSNNVQKQIVVSAETTVDELEAQKNKNNDDIKELEENLKNIQGDSSSKEEYQKQLQEKINLQSDNIRLVSEQIDTINTDIGNKEKSITQLETDIAQQQKNINDGMEQFKLRIRAMYVSGDDSLASVLVGAKDFYDVLSKMNLVTRVAKRDDELINGLIEQLNEYNNNVITLQKEKETLEVELSDANDKEVEYQEKFKQLNEDAEKTQAEIDKLDSQTSAISKSIEDKKTENSAIDVKSAEIAEKIKKQQAAIEAAAAEEAKRKAAAEAEAEAAAKAKESVKEDSSSVADSSSSDESSDSTTSSDSSSNESKTDDSKEPEPSNPNNSDSFAWPVPSCYYISSPFGPRWGTNHNGIDIGASHGSEIVASTSGIVIDAYSGCTHDYGKDSSCGCGGGYGNYIVISNGGSYSTLYGHCSSVAVSVGDYVNQGDVIGYVGSTGYSTGNHLHFEIRVDGSPVDPMSYLGY